MCSDAISSLGLPSSLIDARIASLPESFYYVADFITSEEERQLLEKVETLEKTKTPPFMQSY